MRIKQGDSISPTLFNLVWLWKAKSDKTNIISDEIQIITPVDDLTVVTKTNKNN